MNSVDCFIIYKEIKVLLNDVNFYLIHSLFNIVFQLNQDKRKKTNGICTF